MKKTVRISLITIASLIALGALFLIVVAWPGSTKKIERVADQFQPSSEWVLESETVNPPRLLCLMADCGEIRKVWSRANFEVQNCQDVTNEFGDALREERSQRRDGVIRVCEFKEEVDGLQVVISFYNYDSSPGESRLTMDVM